MNNKNISVYIDQIKKSAKKIKLKDLEYSIQKISTSPNYSRIADWVFLLSLLPQACARYPSAVGWTLVPISANTDSFGFAADGGPGCTLWTGFKHQYSSCYIPGYPSVWLSYFSFSFWGLYPSMKSKAWLLHSVASFFPVQGSFW